MRKAEILRQRLIEDAERMREIDAAVDGDLRPAADAPGGAGEIAEAIDRNDDRLIEGRDVKGRGQMRQMMFDPMHLRHENAGRESFASSKSGMLLRARAIFLSRLKHQP